MQQLNSCCIFQSFTTKYCTTDQATRQPGTTNEWADRRREAGNLATSLLPYSTVPSTIHSYRNWNFQLHSFLNDFHKLFVGNRVQMFTLCLSQEVYAAKQMDHTQPKIASPLFQQKQTIVSTETYLFLWLNLNKACLFNRNWKCITGKQTGCRRRQIHKIADSMLQLF